MIMFMISGDIPIPESKQHSSFSQDLGGSRGKIALRQVLHKLHCYLIRAALIRSFDPIKYPTSEVHNRRDTQHMSEFALTYSIANLSP